MDKYKTYNPETHFLVRKAKGHRKQLTQKQMADILAYRKEKHGYNWIAKKLGISNRRVIDFVKQTEIDTQEQTQPPHLFLYESKTDTLTPTDDEEIYDEADDADEEDNEEKTNDVPLSSWDLIHRHEQSEYQPSEAEKEFFLNRRVHRQKN